MNCVVKKLLTLKLNIERKETLAKISGMSFSSEDDKLKNDINEMLAKLNLK